MALWAMLVVASMGCHDSGSADDLDPGFGTDPVQVAFRQSLDAFDGDPLPGGDIKAFSMLLGDMDLDGDLDYFLNLHFLERMQFFENVGGRFEQFNRRGMDASGLWENDGVADLYGEEGTMLQGIQALNRPGVFVWHDPDPKRSWNFRVVQDPSSPSETVVRLTSNRPWLGSQIPSAYSVVREDAFVVQVTLPASTAPGQFSLKSMGVTTQLKVERLAGDGSVFVGLDLTEYPTGKASVWKRDPHGMTLVDGYGDSYPDLFVTHGGNLGNLLPPQDPKVDQLFEYIGGSTRYREVAPGVIPAGYGRGRQLAWCDIDGDGANELFSGHFRTDNYLYDPTPAGTFEDRAPEFGLESMPAELSAWIDLDLDGHLDLLYVEDEEFRAALNRPGGFQALTEEPFGLRYPEVEQDDGSGGNGGGGPAGAPSRGPGGVFATAGFQVLDLNCDGALDLVLSAFDYRTTLRVYLRAGDDFVDVTESMGIAEGTGFVDVLPLDLNQDGWMDLVSADETLTWWRNRDGQRFEAVALGDSFTEPTTRRATSGDVDGDGRVDIVCVTPTQRQVLFNESSGPARALRVQVDRPLGSLVRAYRSDGTVQVQQWGAANISRFNQALQPLYFGAGPGVSVVELGIQLPGSIAESTRVPVPPGVLEVSL